MVYRLFKCADFHSEFHALETTRHTPLTDKLVMHYFELPKLPKNIEKDDELKLWLALFDAETEEELKRIEELGVGIMEQAVKAYRSVTADDEFKEIERLRSSARHNEVSALGHARRKQDEKWQKIVAKKDEALAEKDAQIAELLARLDKK